MFVHVRTEQEFIFLNTHNIEYFRQESPSKTLVVMNSQERHVLLQDLDSFLELIGFDGE